MRTISWHCRPNRAAARWTSPPTHSSPMANPYAVVVDVAWLDYHCRSDNWLFNRYPIRQLLATVTAVPIYCNYDQIVWDEIDTLFSEEEKEAMDFFTVEIILEKIISLFYDYLNTVIPQADTSYTFDRWADNNTLVLLREDFAQTRDHANGGGPPR